MIQPHVQISVAEPPFPPRHPFCDVIRRVMKTAQHRGRGNSEKDGKYPGASGVESSANCIDILKIVPPCHPPTPLYSLEKPDWASLTHGNGRYGHSKESVVHAKIEKCKHFSSGQFRGFQQQPGTKNSRKPGFNIRQNQTTYMDKLTQVLDDARLSSDLDERCTQIEEAIRQSVDNQRSATHHGHHHTNTRLMEMIDSRRAMQNTSTVHRSRISKQIQKEVRAIKRLERRTKIDAILEQYNDLKRISGIKSSKDKDLITTMTQPNGQPKHDRKGIADIFATFYETLYKMTDTTTTATTTTTTTTHNTNTTAMTTNNDAADTTHDSIPTFTEVELDKALRQLKNSRAKDKSGIVAEMLKQGGDTLKHVLLRLYNDIIQPDSPTPQRWKQAHISVLFKSGDPKLPQNYRPITIIPLLYKLFARLLYNRLKPTLDAQQAPDQAGFRRKFRTDDHLFTLTMLQETARESQLPLWVATLDFKKAFDTVSHHALWESLQDQGIHPAYINILTRLYTGQTGSVTTDVPSREFNIQRGTKQGDPLSSLLFSCVSLS